MSKVALLPPIAVSAAQLCMTACVLVTGSEFLLVLWVDEGSVSVIPSAKIVGDAAVGSQSQVRLGRTLYNVKIAAAVCATCTSASFMLRYGCIHCTTSHV